jgi:hypothetical protein
VAPQFSRVALWEVAPFSNKSPIASGLPADQTSDYYRYLGRVLLQALSLESHGRGSRIGNDRQASDLETDLNKFAEKPKDQLTSRDQIDD